MYGFEKGSSGAHTLKLRRFCQIVLRIFTVVAEHLNHIIAKFELSKMKDGIFMAF